MTAHPRPLFMALLVVLVLLSVATPAHADDVETPEQVLVDETKRLRSLVVDADGFVTRMEAWHGYAGTAAEMSETLAEYAPLLDQLEQLQLANQLGLFDMLADSEPSLAFIGPLLDTLQNGRQVVDTLQRISLKLVVLGGELDILLTHPTLEVGQLRALRASVPDGVAAIEDAATEYDKARPTLDMAMGQLDTVELQLRQAMTEMLPLFATLGTGTDLDALLGQVFGGAREIKGGLDQMADHAAADIVTLRTLERELLEAEAHHAYAGAEQILDGGDVEAAEHAFGLVAETYATTEWGHRARTRLDQGLERATLSADLGDETAGGVLWLVMALVAGGALAFGVVAWTRRRQRADDTVPPAAV